MQTHFKKVGGENGISETIHVVVPHVERHAPVESHFEGGVGEVLDRLVRVVHGQGHSSCTLKLKDLKLHGLAAVLRGVRQLQGAVSGDHEVSGFVLENGLRCQLTVFGFLFDIL